MANTWTTLLDAVYPIGSVYSAYTSTSPATRFGGTWSAITGKFPYYNAGTDTGGENTHVLTTAEMPEHKHRLTVGTAVAAGSANLSKLVASGSDFYAAAGQVGEIVMADTGSSEAHNNMPAYQTLYAWRRTA